MVKSTLLFCLIVVIWPPQITTLQSMTFQLERVEQIGGQGLSDWQIRVRKFNRTTYSLNGTAILLQDLDDSYEVGVNYAYSSLGNNQFNEYPMKLPRKKVCRYGIDVTPYNVALLNLAVSSTDPQVCIVLFATRLRLPGLLSVKVWHGERAPITYILHLEFFLRPPRDSNQRPLDCESSARSD
ncbi:uncharacterized protein LOC120426298 [Culex pipiens pallens]|uniref:uncharacterized protein LOC120426298 n=1 Tax=Culex pipiens pallens TaxID=42434 RepID=UPI0022AA74F2|nr:uncharacterized protein LOC120426298 [Culex pipiens pallens]